MAMASINNRILNSSRCTFFRALVSPARTFRLHKYGKPWARSTTNRHRGVWSYSFAFPSFNCSFCVLQVQQISFGTPSGQRLEKFLYFYSKVIASDKCATCQIAMQWKVFRPTRKSKSTTMMHFFDDIELLFIAQRKCIYSVFPTGCKTVFFCNVVVIVMIIVWLGGRWLLEVSFHSAQFAQRLYSLWQCV